MPEIQGVIHSLVGVAGCWDSNGDGIGDFEGIGKHLDDLADMGMSELRFQQVTRFDDDFQWYGLVALDWFDVDPVFGTMADFDRLMADCRARDFAIMVMAVPEYLGWHHPPTRTRTRSGWSCCAGHPTRSRRGRRAPPDGLTIVSTGSYRLVRLGG